jgi:hypothetical protein
MASAVDICNLSLVNLTETPNLSSISAPYESARAEQFSRFYPIARDYALAKGAWTWATRRVALSSTTPDVESSEYEYAFALPSDFLRLLVLLPEGATDESRDALDFVVEGDVLYTTTDVVYLRYTKRITDTTKFSPLFVVAVASLLSSYMAANVGRGESDSAYWLKRALEVDLPAAAMADANNQRPSRRHVPVWMASR